MRENVARAASKTARNSLREPIQRIKDAYEAGDFVRCAALCRPLLARPPRPIDVGVAVCYGKCLLQLEQRCDEALPFLRRAAHQCPREPEAIWADTQTFLAVALAASGEFEEAADLLHAFAGARLGSATGVGILRAQAILAATDDWSHGWSLHETRRGSPAVALHGLEAARRWNGADGPASLGVIDEQGLGDAVLMARWIPWLTAKTGQAPRFYGRRALRRWIEAAGCEFVERPVERDVRDSGAESLRLMDDDVVLAMSLPHLARCASPADVPAPFAPGALLEARARHVAGERVETRRKRVGVCWTSSGANLNKKLRFLPEQFAEVWAPLDGAEFVNLTHDARVGANAPFDVRRFADVYETGQVLASLDLVVTVDTLVAHLAGSLGVPTIVIAPTYYDWRYRWPGEDGSEFYPSVSVLRQRTGDDRTVLSRARARIVDAIGSH